MIEELPEDINDYIVSFISELEDLLTIPQINKSFVDIAKRYRHPLTATDKEWTENKWVSVTNLINNTYDNINQISFKRCNITERPLSILLMNKIKVIDLRECRHIENRLNWFCNFNKLKLHQLALAKCSRLPEFMTFTNNNEIHDNNLECLLLDRQSFKPMHGHVLAQYFGNLRSLGIINTSLYSVSLEFLTKLKHLKYLFLGGSKLFDKRLKHVLFNIHSIFTIMDMVEQHLKLQTNQSPKSDVDGSYTFNYHQSSHSHQRSVIDEEEILEFKVLVQLLRSIFSIIHQLQENGLEIIELSFYEPVSITIPKLQKYKQDNYADIHFDGLTIVRAIFVHLIHKYYGSRLNILDFSCYHNIQCLISKYDGDVKLAIEYVLDLATDEFGQTALHLAAGNGDTNYCRQLLTFGNAINCDARDRRGGTPLFYAAVDNHHEIVHLLIKFGANIFKKKSTKETPMEIACMRSNIETIKIMLKSTSIDNLNDNTKYDNQWSPCHCCCISGNVQILKLLIENGLDYAAQNHWKQSPLHICATKNHVECAKILIHKYDLKQLDLRDEFNKTAESVAYDNNHHDIVKLIKQQKFKLLSSRNKRNTKQSSSLHPQKKSLYVVPQRRFSRLNIDNDNRNDNKYERNGYRLRRDYQQNERYNNNHNYNRNKFGYRHDNNRYRQHGHYDDGDDDRVYNARGSYRQHGRYERNNNDDHDDDDRVYNARGRDYDYHQSRVIRYDDANRSSYRGRGRGRGMTTGRGRGMWRGRSNRGHRWVRTEDPRDRSRERRRGRGRARRNKSYYRPKPK